MSRDEIMAMAREAGLQTERLNQYPAELWEIVRFAALVAAKEREACAQVADATFRGKPGQSVNLAVADAIRARSNP